MDIKELIKAEIKKRIKANRTVNGFPAGTLCAIRIETYEELLSFIDSLPDEDDFADFSKIAEDLEKAARLYAIPPYMKKDLYMDYLDEYPYNHGLEAAFKAGAEWRKNREWKTIR